MEHRTVNVRGWHWLRCAFLAVAWIMAYEPWQASWLPGPAGARAFAKKMAPPPVRFEFKIDPKAADRELLPIPPAFEPSTAFWLITDLADVPQILFQKPPVPGKDRSGKFAGAILQGGQRVSFADLGEHGQNLANLMVPTAHDIAKINHLNRQGVDHFMKVLLKNRPDLAGLPFAMGDACRMDKKQSARFVQEVNGVRAMLQDKSAERKLSTLGNAEFMPLRIATWMQMLTIEPLATQQQLVGYLEDCHGREANEALARLAVFSTEDKVRAAAIAVLAKRGGDKTDAVLLRGLHYPWPEVARHAASAIVNLERKSLIDKMVDFLDEPDPRAPVVKHVDGREVSEVRELVKINHNQNCLLCHAPGNTPDVKLDHFGRTPEVLTAAVPIMGQPLPPPSQGYDPSSSPDIRIRADVTYLRQDFSLLQPVAKADPWPRMQRFDFLVRMRSLTASEAAAYQKWRAERGSAELSPNHRAALTALRALTGLDAAPNSQAWRQALAKISG